MNLFLEYTLVIVELSFINKVYLFLLLISCYLCFYVMIMLSGYLLSFFTMQTIIWVKIVLKDDVTVFGIIYKLLTYLYG